jgi:iron donor protein CyaY
MQELRMSQPEFSDDSKFRLAVGQILEALLEQVDEIDSDDLDPRLSPGNLQVVFEDSGATFVLSQQTPTHELWLSANLKAWHFQRVDGTWFERDSGEPMLDILGQLFSGRTGQAVEFKIPAQ